MEDIHEIRKHQHHSKIAIYAIVGFLIFLPVAVLVISKQLQSQQAYQLPSQASEMNYSQPTSQPQPTQQLGPSCIAKTKCEALYASLNSYYNIDKIIAEIQRKFPDINCSAEGAPKICEYLQYLLTLKSQISAALSALCQNITSCHCSDSGALKCFDSCDSMYFLSSSYISYLEKIEQDLLSKWHFQCDNLNKDEPLCIELKAARDNGFKIRDLMDNFCRNIKTACANEVICGQTIRQSTPPVVITGIYSSPYPTIGAVFPTRSVQ